MCEFSALNQKNSSPSENLENAVNDTKGQTRKIELLHENIEISQNELPSKIEIIKSLMEIQLTVFDFLFEERNDTTISDLHHQ